MTLEPEHLHKKAKTMNKIGTHSGTFHADECLAVFMLKLLPRFSQAEVVRSRQPEVLEECDIIVDVQGEYDGEKHFDHHQRGFSEVFGEPFHTKLSSAGLIYKHFGKEVISEILDVKKTDPVVDILHPKIYGEFIEAIDANDNGIAAYSEDLNLKPLYKTQAISLPSIISRLNPLWSDDNSNGALDIRFKEASNLIGSSFRSIVISYGKGWYPAKQFVQQAFDQRLQYDDKGRIVVFEEFVPWKEHLYQIETENDASGQVLYVVYSDGSGYRIQAVAVSSSSFTSRKPLPEPWRGARDEKLSEITGVPGGIFIHASGFIGGHKTKEGALQLAKLALDFE